MGLEIILIPLCVTMESSKLRHYLHFLSDFRLSEFKTVEKYGQDVMEKINERNKIRRNGGNYTKVCQSVYHCFYFLILKVVASGM